MDANKPGASEHASLWPGNSGGVGGESGVGGVGGRRRQPGTATPAAAHVEGHSCSKRASLAAGSVS